MVERRRFSLVYTREFVDDLQAIDLRRHSLVRRTIEEQPAFEPDRVTRNRKPLLRSTSFGADWELRFGPGHRFRVFYRIEPATREVEVLAIGVKEGNRLFIGGEEVSP